MTGEKDPRDVMQAEHDARLSEHPAFQAPAEMPGEIEVAQAIASFRKHITPASAFTPDILPSERAQASAVLAIFAPMLAEKERAERELQKLKEEHKVDVKSLISCLEARNRTMNDAIERALAAEAALAAERERCAKIADDNADNDGYSKPRVDLARDPRASIS